MNSGICRKRPARVNLRETAKDGHPSNRQRGYTLLEVTIVLLITGLIGSIVAPELPRIYGRMKFELQRETFEYDLARLPAEARERGETYVLMGTYPRPSLSPQSERDMAMALNRIRPVLPPTLGEAGLTPPAAWELKIEDPIVIRPSGYCSGGQILAVISGAEYTYTLPTPDCLPRLGR